MKKSKRESVRDSTARLQRAARQRADDEARRIPWQRLLDTQKSIHRLAGVLSLGSLDPRGRRRAYQIGWLKFSTTAVRDFSKPKKRSHPKQPRPGLWFSAWKIGLRITSSASPSRKARSSQLRITPYEIRATSEPKCAGRSAGSGRKPNRSVTRRSRSGKHGGAV